MYNDIHSGFYCQECGFYTRFFAGSNEEPEDADCVCEVVTDCPYYIDKMEGENNA